MNKHLNRLLHVLSVSRLSGGLIGLLWVAGVSSVLADGPANTMLVTNVGETEVTATTPDGKVETRRVPVDRAPPGALVVYTTMFRNRGAKSAADIAITNPVPLHTTLVADSVFGEHTVVTYSVDGGKTFAAPEKLRVRMPDGAERPALPPDYTHVHWVYQGALAPNTAGKVGFRVIVN